MTKKQLKEYAIKENYPMELWEDSYSIKKLKCNILHFFERMQSYNVIFYYDREKPLEAIELSQKVNRLKIELNLENE
jgi:hypothetical protein